MREITKKQRKLITKMNMNGLKSIKIFYDEHKVMKQKTTKRRSLEDCVGVAKTKLMCVCYQKKEKKNSIFGSIENIQIPFP